MTKKMSKRYPTQVEICISEKNPSNKNHPSSSSTEIISEYYDTNNLRKTKSFNQKMGTMFRNIRHQHQNPNKKSTNTTNSTNNKTTKNRRMLQQSTVISNNLTLTSNNDTCGMSSEDNTSFSRSRSFEHDSVASSSLDSFVNAEKQQNCNSAEIVGGSGHHPTVSDPATSLQIQNYNRYSGNDSLSSNSLTTLLYNMIPTQWGSSSDSLDSSNSVLPNDQYSSNRKHSKSQQSHTSTTCTSSQPLSSSSTSTLTLVPCIPFTSSSSFLSIQDYFLPATTTNSNTPLLETNHSTTANTHYKQSLSSTSTHQESSSIYSTQSAHSNDNTCEHSSSGSTFFLKDDFESSTWLEVVTTSSSEQTLSVGFAAVMTATVIIHPILFAAGFGAAVWAVGVLHAIEKGYEFFSDGSFSQLFWQEQPSSALPFSPTSNPSNDCIIPQENSVTNNQGTTNTFNDTNQDSNTCSIHSTPRNQALTTITTSTKQTSIKHNRSKIHYNDFNSLIQSYTTPLEQNVVKNIEFPGLNAFEFFQVFFSDDAPYDLRQFQEQIGDIDVQYTKWKPLNSSEPLSFHPSSSATLNIVSSSPVISSQERELSFKSLTKSYFGPAYASVKKTCRAHYTSNNLLWMEMKTELFDIPFCDRFYVLERWVIQSDQANYHDDDKTISNAIRSCQDTIVELPKDVFTSKLDVSVEVFITKSCTWEKQIRERTLGTVKDVVESWCKSATEALKLTLKKKMDRVLVDRDTTGQTTSSGEICPPTPQRPTTNHIPKSCTSTPNNRTFISNEEEILMRMHRRKLAELETQWVSGDFECIHNIEIQHCLGAGKARAYAKVLSPKHKRYLGSMNRCENLNDDSLILQPPDLGGKYSKGKVRNLLTKKRK